MAYSSSIAKTKRDGSVSIITGSPSTYVANFQVGDFSWEEIKPELIVIFDRATIVGARNGNDPTITGSFTCHLRALHDGANEAMLDLISTGSLSGVAQASTGGVGYEPFLCTITYTIDATALGDSKSYTATFGRCQMTASITEGDPDSIAVSFTSLGGVSYT